MINRTEQGWAGHFICADSCQFRRNTMLERLCDGERVIVSTVGAMLRPIPNGEYQEVGCERTYETAVFLAEHRPPYWEADVSNPVEFESEWYIEPHSKKKLIALDDDLKANRMHEDVVDEMIRRLESNETFERKET